LLNLDMLIAGVPKRLPPDGGRRRRRGRLCLAALILATMGCSDQEVRRGPTIHPVVPDLASGRFPHFLREDTASTEEIRSFELLSVPLGPSAIGVRDGDPDFLFGNLTDAVVIQGPGGSRRLALLDVNTAEILLFTLDGQPLARAGGFGEGPGEIASPASLGSGTLPDEVVVADHFGRLHVFRVDADTLAYSRRIDVGVPIEEGCMVGPQPIVMIAGAAGDTTALGSPTLYSIDASGRLSHGFGVPYFNADPVARYWYSMGHLACSVDMAYAAYARLGEVHSFSPDGERVWIRRLPGFSLVKSFLQDNSFAYDQRYRGVLDMVEGIDAVGSRFLAVRVLSVDYSESPASSSTKTQWMRSRDGAVLGSLPHEIRVLGGDDSSVVLYSDDPFPRFLVRSLPSRR